MRIGQASHYVPPAGGSQEIGLHGVTIGQAVEWLPAGTKLRMLRDQVLVRVLPWNPSRTLKVVSNMRPLRGVVVAVGPGRNQRRYYREWNAKERKYEVTKMGDTGRVEPCGVHEGETVEVGGLELRGYSFVEIMIGAERHIICQDADIAVVDDDPIEPPRDPVER